MTTEEQLKNVLERLSTLENQKTNAAMIVGLIGNVARYLIVGFVAWALGRRMIQAVSNVLKSRETRDALDDQRD